MPDAAAPAGGAQAQQGRGNMLGSAFRGFLVFMLLRNLFGGGKQAPPPGMAFHPRVARGDPMSMRVFLNEQPTMVVDDLDAVSTAPVWQQTDFSLPLPVERSHVISYQPSKAVQNNGTLYLHAVFEATVLEKTEADLLGSPHTLQWVRSWRVNEYLPAPKVVEGVNLLSGKNDEGQETTQAQQRAAAAAPREVISYIKPNLTISLVDEQSILTPTQILPQQQPWIHLDNETRTYLPTVFFNDFWTLRDYMVPVNETVSQLQLQLNLNSVGPWKWMMYLQMEQSFSMQKSMGAMAEGDTDEFKRVLLEGNPFFLGLTFCVSMLHSVFDMLAFKNDIGFWKNKQNVEGLSIKTIFINCFCQVVIFLYLLDNDTSFVILASTFVGILIEFWKITKAMDVTLDRSGPLPRLRFQNRESYQKSRTQEYDAQAMRYLSYVLYPLVFGYAIYSLVYKPHKSWYSWVLNTAVGSVYLFGFILMCPQLYLNYRLKSVAHLPWRQMSYKFLNTIIDDLFAFVIKMPTLHRLSVFRDDLVFLVYLYQRWIYPVDKKRANEFGYTAEAEEAAAEPQQLGASGDAPSPAAPKSDSSDDFEDLGQDADALQLRQRRQTAGGNGASTRRGADDKAAAAGTSAGNGASKKGR